MHIMVDFITKLPVHVTCHVTSLSRASSSLFKKKKKQKKKKSKIEK